MYRYTNKIKNNSNNEQQTENKRRKTKMNE